MSKEKDQESFIRSTSDKKSTSIINKFNDQLEDFVWKGKWPIIDAGEPLYKAGGEFKKNVLISLTEKEWNTIDRHLKNLTAKSKAAWIKKAIFTLIALEQQKFIEELK